MDNTSHEQGSLPISRPCDTPSGMGHFNNAHHFTVNNLAMYEATQHSHTHVGYDTFQALITHVIEGAEFDSSERDPPPRCHPGTRHNIIQTILTWRHNSNRVKRVLWLNGPAGVGKSAIIQTLAELESESPENWLGATLFFSRLNERNNPSRALATIAYQLAVKDSSYRNYVTERIAANPRLLGKSMSEQFKLFITRPFGELMIWKGPDAWSIYLDGLDECDGERMQCSLVELICEFTLKFSRAPLVWIIASRPERHLQTLFSRDTVQRSHQEVTVPVNSPQGCQDVERFLRKGFVEIRDNYPDLIPSSSSWPTESEFLEIARAASGLFIFASTVIRFIGIDSMYGDPVTQLGRVLLVVKKAKSTVGADDNPLSALDALYAQIMSTVDPSKLSVAKQILGFSTYPHTGHPFSLIEIANILGLKQHMVYNALQRLHSVIDVPKPEDAPREDVTVLHASFADYLRDPERSHEYTIDPTEFNILVWRGYTRILREANENTRGINAVTLSWPWPDMQQTGLSSMVRRARDFWAPMLMSMAFKIDRVLIRVPIPTSELLEVFDKISFDRLELYVPESHDFIPFLMWMRYHSPPELRNRLLTEKSQASVVACTHVLNRISGNETSYKIIYWPCRGSSRCGYEDRSGRAPSGSLHDYFEVRHSTKMPRERLRELSQRGAQFTILAGRYAFTEEKARVDGEAVKVYILRLSDPV